MKHIEHKNLYTRSVCYRMNLLAMKAACGEDDSITQLFFNELRFARSMS